MGDFYKIAYNVEKQIATLQERGLIIKNSLEAQHYLSNISYFRLSAYTRPFYLPGLVEHRFLPGTQFEDVLNLYIFDRELRLLLLDAVERIEIALRAQIGNTLADHHGPHGYLNAKIFDTKYNHNWLLNKLEQIGEGRQVERFLAHYHKKYKKAPKHPPIWMAMELLTFKEVSTLLSNLRCSRDTQRIEHHFGLKMPVLRSWFRSLSDLRNSCAHHGRIWNREFGSRPMIPKKTPLKWPAIPKNIQLNTSHSTKSSLDPSRRLYLQLVAIETLMQIVSPSSQWAERLIMLLDSYPKISRPHMGFPDDWERDSFWKNAVKAVRSNIK